MYHKGAQERSWDCLLRGEGDLRLKAESWEELGDPRNRVQKHRRIMKEQPVRSEKPYYPLTSALPISSE